jgi:hypothetical protein
MSFFSSIRLNYQIKLIIFLKNVILFDVISDWVLFLSYLKIKDFIVVILFKTRIRSGCVNFSALADDLHNRSECIQNIMKIK